VGIADHAGAEAIRSRRRTADAHQQGRFPRLSIGGVTAVWSGQERIDDPEAATVTGADAEQDARRRSRLRLLDLKVALPETEAEQGGRLGKQRAEGPGRGSGRGSVPALLQLDGDRSHSALLRCAN